MNHHGRRKHSGSRLLRAFYLLAGAAPRVVNRNGVGTR